MSSVPEKHAPHSMDLQEGVTTPEDRGWLIALIFVAFALAIAILFAVYALAWNGGAHT